MVVNNYAKHDKPGTRSADVTSKFLYGPGMAQSPYNHMAISVQESILVRLQVTKLVDCCCLRIDHTVYVINV